MKTENCYNCGTELDARLKEFCGMVYEAFGWQGGTIHQIVREIKRLKDIEQKHFKG